MVDWKIDGADWPSREHSRFVTRGGIRWHVQVLGSGPTLLLVHGTGASSHSFRDLAPLLAERFTVIVPDLPGQGFSRAPPAFQPSLPGMAAALAELLAELDVTPTLAVGHSAGAAIVTRMALDRQIEPYRIIGLAPALVPFRGLGRVLFAPAARLLADSGLAAQLIALRGWDAGSVDKMLRGTGSALDERGVELYRRLARSPDHVAAVLAMLSRWDLEPLFADLPRLAAPVLLVGGELDKAIPPRQLREVAARVPRSRVELVAGAGHLVHEEKPALVASFISG